MARKTSEAATPVEERPYIAPRVDLHNEDCITGMERRISSGSVHLIVTSIPFEEL